MIKPLQQNFNGDDLNAATSGIIYFRLEENCTIKAIEILTKENTTGDLTFNLNLAGIDLFAGNNRPKILTGNKLAELNNLNIAGNKYDEVILNLEAITSGVVKSPLTLILRVDDGVSANSPGGFKDITWGTKTNCTETDGILQNNNTVEGWGTSGAFSNEYIEDTGEFRYIVGLPSNGKAKMGGLSFVDVNANFNTINNAFNFSNDAAIWESGNNIPNTSTTIVENDDFRWQVFRNDAKVRFLRYIKNGVAIRTIQIGEGKLYFDLAFFGPLAQFGKPQIKTWY